MGKINKKGKQERNVKEKLKKEMRKGNGKNKSGRVIGEKREREIKKRK